MSKHLHSPYIAYVEKAYPSSFSSLRIEELSLIEAAQITISLIFPIALVWANVFFGQNSAFLAATIWYAILGLIIWSFIQANLAINKLILYTAVMSYPIITGTLLALDVNLFLSIISGLFITVAGSAGILLLHTYTPFVIAKFGLILLNIKDEKNLTKVSTLKLTPAQRSALEAKENEETVPDKAIARYDHAIRISPANNSEWFLSKGRLLLKKGYENQALADFEKAIHLSSTKEKKFEMLSAIIICTSMENPTNTRHFVEYITKYNLDSAPNYHQLATKLYDAEQWDLSFELVNKGIDLQKTGDLHCLRAELNIKSRNYEDSVIDMEIAIELLKASLLASGHTLDYYTVLKEEMNPGTYPEIRKIKEMEYLKGIVYFEQGNDKAASNYLKNFHEFVSYPFVRTYQFKELNAAFYLGKIFKRSDNHESAIEYFTKTINRISYYYRFDFVGYSKNSGKLYKHYYEALFLRAESLYSLNRLTEAENDLNTFISQNPKSSVAYMLRAKIRLSTEKFGEARIDFKMACENNSTEISYWIEWWNLEARMKDQAWQRHFIQEVQKTSQAQQIIDELRKKTSNSKIIDTLIDKNS